MSAGLDSFAYVRPGQTGELTTTLLGTEMSGNDRVPVALNRIGGAWITLQSEGDATYINDREPPAGDKHVIVDPENTGVVLASSDVAIDATTGALKWRWMTEDTAVANQDVVDVVEYLATITINHADTTAPSTFDRWIYATHRLRIPVRPALCVPSDVFQQMGGFTQASEQLLPMVEWACEAVTDRFEQETERLVRHRRDTEYLYVDDDGPFSLNLRRFPLTSIVSVKELSSGEAIPEAFEDVDPIPLSEFLPPASDVGKIGVLRRRSRFTPRSVVEVVYEGGIAQATGSMPPSLRNAGRRFAAFLVKHADKVGITSITAKDSSTTLYATDMPDDVRHVYRSFRRLV